MDDKSTFTFKSPIDKLTFTLRRPITDEMWDKITDSDFEHTDRIWFETKHGKVEFVKASAQPEQKIGKWILYEKSRGFPDWCCSACNGSGRGDYLICPWCGAKMEK